ncbi:MAG: cyclic nucleotide-binding domain-containing protein [Solirubrobacterales bacterium]
MPTRSIDQLLATVPTFAGLPSDWLELVSGCGRNSGFEVGRYLAREGDPADAFYLIRQGRVALEIAAPGSGALMIETLGEGAVLGWSWLFPPFKWSFDARATEPVRAIAFDGACLRGKCDADNSLGYELMRRFAAVMLDRLQATRLQLLDVYGGVAGE